MGASQGPDWASREITMEGIGAVLWHGTDRPQCQGTLNSSVLSHMRTYWRYYRFYTTTPFTSLRLDSTLQDPLEMTITFGLLPSCRYILHQTHTSSSQATALWQFVSIEIKRR